MPQNVVQAQAESALRRRVEDGTARPSEAASLAAVDLERGNLESAIKLYRKALGQDYQRSDWRLGLAQALAQSKQFDDAIHEVKIVLRLRPRDAQATKLLEELTTRSEKHSASSGR